MGGAEISHNYIADNRATNQRVSCGIYLDDGSSNVRVHDNIIVGSVETRCGLFTHKGNKQIDVFNNTFWGQKEAGWLSAVWDGSRDAKTMIYRNNLASGNGFVTTGVGDSITETGNQDNVSACMFIDTTKGDFRLSGSD